MGGESFLPSIYEVAVAALLFAALPSAFWEGASETLLPEQAEVSDATARLRQSGPWQRKRLFPPPPRSWGSAGFWFWHKVGYISVIRFDMGLS